MTRTSLPANTSSNTVVNLLSRSRIRNLNRAERSRADAIAEAEEFALDAAVSPARVLPGQAPDQFTDLLRDRRASGGVRVGPFFRDQAPVPGEQGPRRHDPLYPKVPGQQPRQG